MGTGRALCDWQRMALEPYKVPNRRYQVPPPEHDWLENPPFEDGDFLLNMVVFQLAILVFGSVSFRMCNRHETFLGQGSGILSLAFREGFGMQRYRT